MQNTAVLLAVGLTRPLIDGGMPRLRRFAARHAVCSLRPVLPAVTCSVQACILTGRPVREHGIVGNGWYNRELAEVQFWKQSNRLVQGEKIWDTARHRDPAFTCANLFWWFNMYSSADVSVTPRPIYKADGRKVPDVYTEPAGLRDDLQDRLGRFPLFSFWGPRADIHSTRWIVDAAQIVQQKHNPTLTLIYLPHLDYALQRAGPAGPEALQAAGELDVELDRLIRHYEARATRVIVLSEYAIEPVDDAVHVNRVLHQEGLLRIRDEGGGELLDAGASRAFAVADHQVAQVYVRDAADVARVADICGAIPGVEQVLDRAAQAALEIDHQRAGELVLVAAPRRWFSYNYWLDDSRAPDFARTVDIHRKPGYDPCELFIDPTMSFSGPRIAWKMLRSKLGFRTLFDVIPLDASLVRGSHGRPTDPANGPVLIAPAALLAGAEALPCGAIHDLILNSVFGA